MRRKKNKLQCFGVPVTQHRRKLYTLGWPPVSTNRKHKFNSLPNRGLFVSLNETFRDRQMLMLSCSAMSSLQPPCFSWHFPQYMCIPAGRRRGRGSAYIRKVMVFPGT